MDVELVNVSGVREKPFTAELIVPAEGLGYGIVGLYEESGEGNLGGGVSVWPVRRDEYETTGELFKTGKYTPQRV